MPDLSKNWYLEEAAQTGKYKYDVSVLILAYNHLDYTRRCVESFLQTVPPDLNYELILVNHGSSDGTKEYFEKIGPHKQLNIAVNGGGGLLYTVSSKGNTTSASAMTLCCWKTVLPTCCDAFGLIRKSPMPYHLPQYLQFAGPGGFLPDRRTDARICPAE